MMKEFDIPGVAVAVIVDDKSYYFSYGVASRASESPVTEHTIFEIGSVSKIFTATLAGYAQSSGSLSLSDNATKYLPELASSSFDTIQLLHLGTYTAGGLPLQFPDSVSSTGAMIDYFRNWKPAYEAGTHRMYSNPSIGLFGFLTAKSLHSPFPELMENTIFPELGMHETYINVPPDRMKDYAYGYAKDRSAVRVNPGMLDSETYGVKTTAADMARFLKANLDTEKLNHQLQQAVALTQTGYYKTNTMTQGLGWEIFEFPVELEELLAGNSTEMVFEAHAVTRVETARPADHHVLLNKTGSTNGFGAYIVCVPSKNRGIVILANRNYPIPERIKAAYKILSVL
jgi:beta-lactamase class C